MEHHGDGRIEEATRCLKDPEVKLALRSLNKSSVHRLLLDCSVYPSPCDFL